MLIEVVPEAVEIISEALEKYKNPGLGFSGGSDSIVLLHLVRQFKSNIPVIFVNTFHQFPETYEYINKIVKDWHLNYYEYHAKEDKLEEFKKKYPNKEDFIRECCLYHKIKPMLQAIRDLKFDAFFVGLRGVEHPERAKETFFSKRENPPHIRVHPLLNWTREDILDYIAFYRLPVNPLYKKGYSSLGCIPCTKPNPDITKHERSGRDQVRERIMKVLREAGYT